MSPDASFMVNYGILFTAWGVAGILGPSIGGRVFDAFGDAPSALAIVAFVSLSLVLAPGPESART